MFPPRLSRRQIVVAAVGLSAVALTLYLASALSKARLSIREATARVSHDGEIAFRVIPLDRPVPAGFEPLSAAAQFNDAVPFGGRFYLCGPAGLLAFDLNGSLVAQYRPGMELPPAPLAKMAVSAASGSLGQQLWIATSGEGLIEFDGHTFRQIRPEDPGARQLTSVLPLSTGRILLGSERAGVLVWDGKALSELHPSLSGEHITALAGSEADLWAGTIDHGLLHWHAGQLDHFSEGEGLPDPRILSLEFHADRVFAGTPLGVAEIRDGRFTRALAAGFFANALLAQDDKLLVGTLEEGVIDVPLATRRPRLRGLEAATNLGKIERLLEIDNHTYALADGGLYERGHNSGEFHPVFDVPGARLTDRNISALTVDRAGKLWVGYFDRGLDVVDAGFGQKTHFEDEHLFCINRIAADSEANVTAVGTANGLVLFDGSEKPRRVLGKADGLIANQITDVLIRPSGMTVATPAGLTTIGPAGTTSLYAFHGLVNNHVYSLAAAGPRLLAGTLGGLSILDSGLVTASYTTANSGLKHNWITSIVAVDHDWLLGTYGAGVIKLDAAGRWSSFPDLRGELVVNPNAMTVTASAVYAGTLGKGLAAYNRNSGRWTRVTTGLPSLNVTALAQASGYLYIGTDNGLVRIPEAQLGMQ